MTSSNGNIFRVTGPLCGEFTGPGEFPAQRPVTRSFDVFFDLRPNKRLSKQPWGTWFESPSWSLWRQCNDINGCVRHPIKSGDYKIMYHFLIIPLVIRKLSHIWDIVLQNGYRGTCELTHLHLNKMVAISQTIFSDAFSGMTSFIFRLEFEVRS